MASARLKKKELKRLTKVKLKEKIKELENLNQELLDIEEEIKKAKKTLKKNKATLSEIQNQLSKVNQISIRAQELAVQATQKSLPKEIAQSQMPDSAYSYTAIKKYHDYVEKGIIQEQSILDKYQIQDFMERIMSQEEYDDYVQESIKKGEDLLRKDAERRMRHAEERRNYSF